MSKWEIVGNNMLVNDDFKNDAALLLSGDWNNEEEMRNFLTDVCNKLNGYAEIKSEESIGNEPYRKPSEEEKIIDNLKRRITELEAKNEYKKNINKEKGKQK